MAAVACPQYSTGTDVPTCDCYCDAGYSGSVSATKTDPFLDSTCTAVACPKDSTGTNVPSGDCICDDGYSGSVTATAETPFYEETCEGVLCDWDITVSSGSIAFSGGSDESVPRYSKEGTQAVVSCESGQSLPAMYMPACTRPILDLCCI